MTDERTARLGLRHFPLYTTQQRGCLYVPDRMSRKDFDILKMQIENSLDIILATAVEETEQSLLHQPTE